MTKNSEMYNILTINPGSTSTKIALFRNSTEVFEEVLRHSSTELGQFKELIDQYEYRKKAILNFLQEKSIKVEELDAIAARGGLIGPLESGTYRIDEKLVQALRDYIVHPSNLAGLIAYEMATENHLPAFIVDPVTVDEMEELARMTGIPEIRRESKFHALNQKAVAKRVAQQKHKEYEALNFIVVHIGGGISIGAHQKGRVIDVNNVIDGEGPMSPNRAGSIPTGALIDLCFSGKYTHKELKEFVSSKAGILSYLGTSDVREVQEMITKGNQEAKIVYEAMAYQIAKSIGSAATVLRGVVDAIIITGGVAYSNLFVRLIKERVDFLGEVIVVAGEEEMLALAEGAMRVLKGEEKGKLFIRN